MMIKSSLLFLSILIFGAHAYANMTTNYSDVELAALTERRDALKREVAACEADTKKFKIAGITTLGATGVGVFANLYLASEIRDAKNKASGGGGYGGGSGNIGDNTCPEGESYEVLLCQSCRDCFDIIQSSCCSHEDMKDSDDPWPGKPGWTWKQCWGSKEKKGEGYECDVMRAECPRIRSEKGLTCDGRI